MKLRICKKEEYDRYYNRRDYRPVDENDEAAAGALSDEFDKVLDVLDTLLLGRGLKEIIGEDSDFSIHPTHNYTRVADVMFQSQTERPVYLDPLLWKALQERLIAEKLDWMVILQEADQIFVTPTEVIGYSYDLEEMSELIGPSVEIEYPDEG